MAITTFVASQILTAAQMNAVQGNDYNQTVSTKTASYTLVAADKGTRIVMNVTGASTVTVNTSLFSAGDTLTIQNISATACTVSAGTATVSSAGPLAIPQNGSGLLYFTSAGVSIFYPSAVTASSAGLVCVKAETALSGASTTADGVFTSSYTNYRIIIRYTTSADALCMQFRAATVDTATNYNFQALEASSTTVSASRSNAQTKATLGDAPVGSFFCLCTLEISGVQLAEPTVFIALNERQVSNYTAMQIQNFYGNQSASTAFDGIKFLVASGTMSGVFSIYGYSKTV